MYNEDLIDLKTARSHEIVDGDAHSRFRLTGIECIRQLQLLVGNVQTYKMAEEEWDVTDRDQRINTLQAYQLMFSEGEYVILDPNVRS